MPYFDPVDPRVDFSALEREKLDWWYKKGIVKKYLQKNKSSKKYFSFLDGPITANNPMGVHHAWGRTYKDLWQRYKNMQGFRQRFQNGFDCQGLWVEVEVEKELGFKSKKDIEKYGVEKFVQKCRDRVKKYSQVQTEQSKRLGYFMDWDNSYYTMSDENNYMIWHFLKVCHNNGWLYKGKDSVPWCPRCETAISQHEILSEDYKELVHESIYFKMPLVGKDNEYLLVWTTTPWTLPANVAVAVHKDLDYLLVKSGNSKCWVARGVLERVFGSDYKVIRSAKGSELVGLKYEWVFDDLERVKEARKESRDLFHSVVETDERILPITTEEGTGLVHVATGAGTEDFALGKKLGLPVLEVIKDDASYLEGLGQFSGKNAKDDPEIILRYLKNLSNKDKDWVLRIHKYKHRYPACWRCKEELVWKVTDEWYIAMDKGKPTLRERMKKVAENIKWIPKFGLKRELDWLNNMHDWLISKKNRYWGLALPIWECEKCGNFEVMGSKAELKEKVVKGWEKFEDKSPHKPQIDEIKIKCEKCGEEASRIEPVGNPWLDAGIVAYSTISEDNKGKPLYLSDKKKWERWIPADFITESFPGQFKNWFYSIIAMSTVLEDLEPTRVILGHENVYAEDGRAMHKSWGNAIEFSEGAEKIGVDVMRWMFTRQNPRERMLFGYRLADDVRRKFHLKLWNIYSFFVTYANLDGWKPKSQSSVVRHQMPVLDRWILARLSQVVKSVTKYLDEYDAFGASEVIEEFVEDLSNWYIRRSRERIGPAAESEDDKKSFYVVAYYLLINLAKVLAPFIPYITDEIFQNLSKHKSVHLTNWPQMSFEVDTELIDKMTVIREIVEQIHSRRKEKNIPVRQPLSLVEIVSTSDKPSDEILRLLQEETNIKKVIWKQGKILKVKLDTKVTPVLKEEADTRELIRKIQIERKEMGLNLTHITEIVNSWVPKDKKLVEWLLRKTSSTKISKSKAFKVVKTS